VDRHGETTGGFPSGIAVLHDVRGPDVRRRARSHTGGAGIHGVSFDHVDTATGREVSEQTLCVGFALLDLEAEQGVSDDVVPFGDTLTDGVTLRDGAGGIRVTFIEDSLDGIDQHLVTEGQ